MRTILFFIYFGFCKAALPTLYEYYTSDGITSGLSVDQPFFTLNGRNISVYSGAMHYFRVPSEYWRDRLRKLRATGLNTVETYIPWNLHEPQKGFFEFGRSGSEMESFTDLETFLQLAQEEDLFVIVRPGPYICAEWEWGGFPSWLLREKDIKIRTSDPKFMKHVSDYFNILLPKLAEFQFSKGGPIIALQVENEYASYFIKDLQYILELHDLYRSNGIVELLFTSDGPGYTGGTIPGLLFLTANFGGDIVGSFRKLEEMQPGKPLMAMEFYPGWFDHWAEPHQTVSELYFKVTYELVLFYPGSINLYMFHGGTNFGFMNGANGNNDGFQPTTTSYDYDAPLSEAGDYTDKYFIIKELLDFFNPIQTLTPDRPELVQRKTLPTVSVTEKINFEGIIEQAPNVIVSEITYPMEELPINDNNGQSYGYVNYRTILDIPASSVLTITGFVYDTILVLINGVLVNRIPRNHHDLNGFGFWRLQNSSIALTDTDLKNATLDLMIENMGRVNYYYMENQFKGLTQTNQVLLNGEGVQNWMIYPLEFRSAWTNNLNFEPALEEFQGPALFKATLKIENATDCTDVFVDMRGWTKGIVIINGFVLGRYLFLGPQEALYLPKQFLMGGDNEIVVFEHFRGNSEIRFVTEPIYST